MNYSYKNHIEQNYEFPQAGFELTDQNTLLFHKVDLLELAQTYGPPLKFTYLPKISQNINKVKGLFTKAIDSLNYKGTYQFCYCTKSSHFSYILDEVLKNKVNIETSSSFDINIIKNLIQKGKVTSDTLVLCNGYKPKDYIQSIASLINSGHSNTLSVLDNMDELALLQSAINTDFSVGIRIATEEEPKFKFYTSRLGIGYKDIPTFYKKHLAQQDRVTLKMLHFFIGSGIRDRAYYWNELLKCIKVYVEVKKVCPTLDSLNIGGGMPIQNSLDFDFDYEYMIYEILHQIKLLCEESDVAVPNIYTEFGSYTVGESSGIIYKILSQKKQNDRENWNMINSSFITSLPDSWAINKKFILLAINRWNKNYEKVQLGGLTCDSDDFYNAKQEQNAIYLPKYSDQNPLYIGFFHTGAYQETLGGYGGIQHCLIPRVKHILIEQDENNQIQTSVFNQEQNYKEALDLLGY